MLDFWGRYDEICGAVCYPFVLGNNDGTMSRMQIGFRIEQIHRRIYYHCIIRAKKNYVHEGFILK